MVEKHLITIRGSSSIVGEPRGFLESLWYSVAPANLPDVESQVACGPSIERRCCKIWVAAFKLKLSKVQSSGNNIIFYIWRQR